MLKLSSLKRQDTFPVFAKISIVILTISLVLTSTNALASATLVPETIDAGTFFRHNDIAVDASDIPYVYNNGTLYKRTTLGWVQQYSITPVAGYYPSLLVDQSNNIHAFYHQSDSSNNYRLYHAECSATLPTGSSCPAAEEIVTRPDENPSAPEFGYAIHNSVVEDSNGNLHLVYGYYYGYWGLFYTERTGGVWSTPTRVHPGTPNEGYMLIDDASLRLDPDGTTLHVAFNNRSNFQVPYGVYYGTKTPTGTWAVEPVIQDSAALQKLAMAMDGATPLIVYSFRRPDTLYDLRLATRLASGSWTHETLYAGATGGIQDIDADVLNGTLHVIFDHGSGSSDDFRPVYITKQLSTGTPTSQRIYDFGFTETAFVSMAAGPSAIHISFNHNQDALKYLNISQVSQAPVAADDSYSTDEDTALSVTASGVLANDTDPDADALTAVLDTATGNGSLTLNSDGSFVYDPDADFCGSDSFTYHANDGTTDSNIATVSIDVVCVNDAPDVTVDDDPVVVNEGLTAVNSGAFSDIDSANVTLSASVGTVTDNGNGTWSWSFDTDDGPVDSQTVIIAADDGQDTDQASFTLTVNNVAPSVDSVTVPLDPVDVNDQASFSVEVGFSDPAGTADEPYTCQFDLDYDDTFTVDVTVSNEVGTTNCTTSLNYAEPGVYTVKVNVIDKDGGAGMATAVDFVVIFDPDGGFVTGGGWIASPLGAYSLDPSLIGRANFGFVSKYKKGANVPTGQTEFQFQVADLNFHSSSYEWLVVAGPTAKFKGTGTINGTGNYGFMITATDEKLTPSTSLDLFRFKIWDKDNGDLVVYDNQMGEEDDSDAGTEIGGGNIVIHK